MSGEGPYIEYIGNYYYLFVTYGGLDSKGGYVMRMFRSKNIRERSGTLATSARL